MAISLSTVDNCNALDPFINEYFGFILPLDCYKEHCCVKALGLIPSNIVPANKHQQEWLPRTAVWLPNKYKVMNAAINNNVLSLGVNVFFNSLRYAARNINCWVNKKTIFNFLRKSKSIFHCSFTILHSHQQYRKHPFSLHPQQYFLLSIFFYESGTSECKEASHCWDFASHSSNDGRCKGSY